MGPVSDSSGEDVKFDIEPDALPELRELVPTLPPASRDRLFGRLRVEHTRYIEDKTREAFSNVLRRVAAEWELDPKHLAIRAVCLLVADLIDQGWAFKIGDDRVQLRPPGVEGALGETRDDIKHRIRKGLQAGRLRQLQEPSVRLFLERMERVVRRPEGKHSIASVIDNGPELERLFLKLRRLPAAEQERGAARIIDPVIEPCIAGKKCEYTGLNLIDIWRYFRHTWSLEYRSIPGRQLPLLVRNAARPNRPIIGIAMLASPVMRLRVRDNWIGWTPPAFARALGAGEIDPVSGAAALIDRLDASVLEIRSDDLIDPAELHKPTEGTIFKLENAAAGAAAKRDAHLRSSYDQNESTRDLEVREASEETDWLLASQEHLYVRKRAETLAKLLQARMVINTAQLAKDPMRGFRQLFASKDGWRALDTAIAELRKVGLASQVVDVSVCGAVHPYTDLLGGKLVALVLSSQEARSAYRQTYGGRISLIASQMAGRPIRRSAELKVLTTTSLYGNGSSQYNRLKLRAKQHPDLPYDITWNLFDDEGDRTNGYGTVHLASSTTEALRQLSSVAHGARRVNNRFGEGASPRLRQVREGLDALGIESSHVLHHATPRLFCACEIEPGARQDLLGMRAASQALPPSIDSIGAAWRRRWLLNRIKSDDVLDRVGKMGPESVRAQLWADEEGQYRLPFE